ncbi:hypothetical protein GF327_03680 [Candidatus Woesearchaeota archaeon]|nr:hypothetical protein [Candidatus Woesearchaeota archaeon]
MIYDRNQFVFNIVLSLLLIIMILVCGFFGYKFIQIKNQMEDINTNLEEIEKNQHYTNYIQASHQDIRFQLSPEGFFIYGADDYGTLQGPSMQPSIFDSHTLIQVKYTDQNLSEGQIVRYYDSERTPVIHRIRGVYNNTVKVQGDNLDQDEIIEKNQITHLILGVLFT